MTAPNTSGTQQLIQTILTIKELQHKDAAEQLAREQFGLERAATQDQMLSHAQTLAASLPDAKVLLPHVDTMAANTGLDAQTLRTIFSNAVPGEGVIKSGVLQRGVASAGSALDAPAAFSTLVGKQPGELNMDAFHGLLFKQAQSYLSSLPPDQQAQFAAGVVQKTATGQTPGEALGDKLFAMLPPDKQARAIEIGKGLAPSAADVIQGRLGAGKLALDSHIAESESAYHQMQIAAAMAEVNAKLDGAKKDKAIDMLKAIQSQQQFLSNQSSNLTDEGQTQQNAALNALYLELEKIDPTIGSIFVQRDKAGKIIGGTMPLSAYMTSPGAFSGFNQGFKNSEKKP